MVSTVTLQKILGSNLLADWCLCVWSAQIVLMHFGFSLATSDSPYSRKTCNLGQLANLYVWTVVGLYVCPVINWWCPGCTLPHAQSQLGLDSALLGPLMNKQYAVVNTWMDSCLFWSELQWAWNPQDQGTMHAHSWINLRAIKSFLKVGEKFFKGGRKPGQLENSCS